MATQTGRPRPREQQPQSARQQLAQPESGTRSQRESGVEGSPHQEHVLLRPGGQNQERNHPWRFQLQEWR